MLSQAVFWSEVSVYLLVAESFLHRVSKIQPRDTSCYGNQALLLLSLLIVMSPPQSLLQDKHSHLHILFKHVHCRDVESVQKNLFRSQDLLSLCSSSHLKGKEMQLSPPRRNNALAEMYLQMKFKSNHSVSHFLEAQRPAVSSLPGDG